MDKLKKGNGIKEHCKELDDLHYRIMRAKEFRPELGIIGEQEIQQHLATCPKCKNKS